MTIYDDTLHYMTIYILLFLAFALNIFETVWMFRIVESIHLFREFIKESKAVGLQGGGYYQKITYSQWFALRYLEANCELSFWTLPQGGYVVDKYEAK